MDQWFRMLDILSENLISQHPQLSVILAQTGYMISSFDLHECLIDCPKDTHRYTEYI